MFHFNIRLFCTALLFSLFVSACKKDENEIPPVQMPTAFEIDHTLATQYGGIHYQFGIDNRIIQGSKVADGINALKFK